MSDDAPARKRIWIARAEHHARDAGVDDRACAGRCFATVVAGLERAIERRATRGLAGNAGKGIGLSNLRERLKALYGQRSKFTLEGVAPGGARASIEIPYAAASG